MKGIFTAIGIILFLIVIVITGAISVYNNIVTRHETITSKWAQVENQLQRRNDLIPNLVNSVKGYVAHEKDVYEKITAARSSWSKAGTLSEKVAAAQATDSALFRLLAIAESNPELKANQNFMKLQDELSGSENRIAVERMRYNEAVKDYNITIRTFPGNILAGMFGYASASEYFKSQEEAKSVPEVKF